MNHAHQRRDFAPELVGRVQVGHGHVRAALGERVGHAHAFRLRASDGEGAQENHDGRCRAGEAEHVCQARSLQAQIEMNTAYSATRVPATLGTPTRAAGKPCRSILMVGTSPNVRGGIASLVRSYYNSGLFRRFDMRYVPTHCDGTAAQKAVTALKAYVSLSSLLLTSDAPLVHIHLASRASFWRKFVVCTMARMQRRPYVLHLHGAEFSMFYHQEC